MTTSRTLEELPTEILCQICVQLKENGGSDILRLSLASRRFRVITIPYIFGRLSFVTSPFSNVVDENAIDSRIGLLRTIITNSKIAFEVKEIEGLLGGRCLLAREDLDIIIRATCDFGITPPGGLDRVLKQWRNSEKLPDMQFGLNRGIWNALSNFMTEMLIAHTPNLRSLEYNVHGSPSALKTLDEAVKTYFRVPLLPNLVDAYIELSGSADLVQSLAEAAPALDSLWLSSVWGLESGIQFKSVRVSILTKVDLTAAELKKLLSGFPGLKKFWFTSSHRSTRTGSTSQLCRPQEVVDALYAHNLGITELTLRFNSWDCNESSQDSHTPLHGLLTSTQGLNKLEDLDFDGMCFWGRGDFLHGSQAYDPVKVQALARLLPRSLKKLTLTGLKNGPFYEDLEALRKRISEILPELGVLQCGLRHGRALPQDKAQYLMESFAAQGVKFQDSASIQFGGDEDN
ncbi:uncharacterized protein BDZ83DRAFT_633233 [Colletotrichum acutatum]|uniref:F-box domain-containing protein n=1 Tax=Glomerella acutata TaxID=27357 RepID=A0AAD8UBF6_GLOAC|nr:uncharacterized protein BDZ83DRAFT_633233 [Colletotrichum acutatum]KAK1718062.1 hypothetical protein BDZ83DRAFT_633233 [Colletotrichum acutatum]